MNNVHAVATFLRTLNLDVADVTNFDQYDDTDAAIDLTDGRHIQVGRNYFIIYAKPKRGAVLGAMLAEIEGANLNDLRVALTH